MSIENNLELEMSINELEVEEYLAEQQQMENIYDEMLCEQAWADFEELIKHS